MLSIKCSETGATFTLERIDEDTWHARLDVVGMHVESNVYSYRGWEIVPFFEELARDWRGWEGERTWASIEGELELRLSTDRLGHVSVHVLFDLDPIRDRRAEATLIVDAGQLDDVAKLARTLRQS